MKIYDLTRGKYPKLYAPTAMGAELSSFGAVRRKHHERRVYCVVMNSKLGIMNVECSQEQNLK